MVGWLRVLCPPLPHPLGPDAWAKVDGSPLADSGGPDLLPLLVGDSLAGARNGGSCQAAAGRQAAEILVLLGPTSSPASRKVEARIVGPAPPVPAV